MLGSEPKYLLTPIASSKYVAPDDATFTKSLNRYLDDTGRATASLNQRASLIVETAGGEKREVLVSRQSRY
jgi:hypothetical protein